MSAHKEGKQPAKGHACRALASAAPLTRGWWDGARLGLLFEALEARGGRPARRPRFVVEASKTVRLGIVLVGAGAVLRVVSRLAAEVSK